MMALETSTFLESLHRSDCQKDCCCLMHSMPDATSDSGVQPFAAQIIGNLNVIPAFLKVFK